MHVQWGFLLVLSSILSEKHVHWVKWWSSTFVVLTSKPQIKTHMFSHYHYMKCCVVCTSITSSNLHELIKCLDYCTDILNYPFINEIQALSKCNKKQRTIKFKNPQISSFKFIVNIIWNSQHCQSLGLRYCLMNWCARFVQTQELLKYCSHDLSPFDNAGLREVKLLEYFNQILAQVLVLKKLTKHLTIWVKYYSISFITIQNYLFWQIPF